MLGKEFYGLVHGHLQDVVDALVLELHFQGLGLEALAVARFALQYQVGHELHFYRYRALALAFLAAATLGVEREIAGREAQLLGQWLCGIELAYFVVGLDIGHRIASRRLADRVLVYELNVFHHLDVAFQREMLARAFGAFGVFALQGLVEHIAHQGTLARAAHAGYHGHDVQREAHVDALEVVFAGSFHFDVVVPRTMGYRWVDGFFAQQIANGVAVAAFLEVVHVALVDDLAT